MLHRFGDDRRGETIAHGPTDDFSAKQVDHHGQINPASKRWQVSDIGHPFLIGRRRLEVLIEKIGERVVCRDR